jgi:hypothetical protein
MSLTSPRSQIRLGAVTGSLVAISDVANAALYADSDNRKLAELPAEQISTNTLEGILGQIAASVKRIQGDSDKDFTEVAAGVFTHAESQFVGILSASSDVKVGGSLTVRTTSALSGAVEMKSTLDVDGLATLAQAKVEDLTVAGGIVFTDASGRLDNDEKVAWSGSQFSVDGAISGSGNVLVGGMITASAGMKLSGDLDVDSTADFQGAVQFQSTINVDGKATVASAQVENLTVPGGLVFNDASGNLQNDSKITWDGATLSVSGALDLSGGIIGSSLTAGRVVYVGQDGALTTESGLDYDAAANLLGVSGSLKVGATLDIIGKVSGSTAQFSGQVQAATVKVDSLSQPGVVIAGADGLLTTTASLFYTDSRLEVSSSVRVSGDMAVNGEGGIADITSTASVAALFDAGVDTLYVGGNAEYIGMGEQGGLVDFAGGVRLTGSVEIMGSGAKVIDRIGGELSLRGGDLTGSVGKVKVKLSGSELSFNDGYSAAAGWSGDIALADSSTDWQRFKAVFGEASILSAISTAAALPTDAKFMYKALDADANATSLGGDKLRQVDGTHFSASFAAVPSESRNENVDVFLNGQLLVSKSYDAVNYDYDVAADGTSISFNFGLQPDDFISVLVPQTVASIADWVSGNGTGGGTGGGSGASNLNDLTDVVITSPALNQVLTYDGSNWVNSAAQGGGGGTGATGPQGPQGPAGATGATGPAGSYDIGGSVAGRPASSEIIFRAPLSHATTLTSGIAYCETAPASAVSLDIQKGIVTSGSISYSSVGTIDYTSGAIVGSVTLTGNSLSLSTGNILRVVAPSSQDATFASPTFSFSGSEA